MTHRKQFIVWGSFAAAILALLIVLWQRDDSAEPNSLGSDQPRAASTGQHAHWLSETPPAPATDPVGPTAGAAPAGPERLHDLQVMLGVTYATLGLLKFQMDAMSPADRELATKQVEELEAKAKRQADEIAHFDVNAPPQVYDPYPRSGPAIAVSAALRLTREQWNRLVSKHLAPNMTISEETFEKVQSQLANSSDILNSLTVPAGVSERARQDFLMVVDALMQAETMHDRAEAKKLLASRWDEFMRRVRALSTG